MKYFGDIDSSENSVDENGATFNLFFLKRKYLFTIDFGQRFYHENVSADSSLFRFSLPSLKTSCAPKRITLSNDDRFSDDVFPWLTKSTEKFYSYIRVTCMLKSDSFHTLSLNALDHFFAVFVSMSGNATQIIISTVIRKYSFKPNCSFGQIVKF